MRHEQEQIDNKAQYAEKKVDDGEKKHGEQIFRRVTSSMKMRGDGHAEENQSDECRNRVNDEDRRQRPFHRIRHFKISVKAVEDAWKFVSKASISEANKAFRHLCFFCVSLPSS